MNVAYNMDCMEYMRTLPDKHFELAVVDPPYGGGAVNTHTHTSGLSAGLGEYRGTNGTRFGGRFSKYHFGNQNGWHVGDEVPPERGYL